MESGPYVNYASLSTNAEDADAAGRAARGADEESGLKPCSATALRNRLTDAVPMAIPFECLLRRVGELQPDAIVRFHLELRPFEERPRDLSNDVERVIRVGQRHFDLLSRAENRQRHDLSAEYGDVNEMRTAAFHRHVERVPDREPRDAAGADDVGRRRRNDGLRRSGLRP